METYISDINDMLFMVYIHGGDYGGPYESNIDGVSNAINTFLTHASLKDKYVLSEIKRTYNHGKYLNVPQIIKK